MSRLFIFKIRIVLFVWIRCIIVSDFQQYKDIINKRIVLFYYLVFARKLDDPSTSLRDRRLHSRG